MRKPTEGEIEHEDVETVVCPWCGHENSDLMRHQSIRSIPCVLCRRQISLSRKTTITYTTRKIES